MLLLIADTSGPHGSVALAGSDSEGHFSLIEAASLTGGAFSAELVPQIAGLLARNHLSKAEIDGFVVASGPGSFTGLRVGLAAIKGLAEILNKPIVAVSLLEVAAVQPQNDGRVVAALDAGRQQAYVGEYEVSGGDTTLISERLLSRDELVAVLHSAKPAAFVTPDQSVVGWAEGAGIAVQPIERPASEQVGRVGLKKLKNSQTVTPEQLDANYIRRSDAEIASGS